MKEELSIDIIGLAGACSYALDCIEAELVKILLNREVPTMKFNTQNAKIEAITEKTSVLGIDVGSEMHYARAFDHRGATVGKTCTCKRNCRRSLEIEYCFTNKPRIDQIGRAHV